MKTHLLFPKQFLVFFFCSFIIVVAQAQQNSKEAIQLDWAASPTLYTSGQTTTEMHQFDGAIFTPQAPSVPVFLKTIAINSNSTVRASLSNIQTEKLAVNPQFFKGDVLNDFKISTAIEKDRNQYLVKIAVTPVRKSAGSQYEKLLSATLNIQLQAAPVSTFRGPNITESVLMDGTIFKIAVANSGIHQLTYSFLKDDLGVDIDNINPKNIQLYGAGGGPVPELIAEVRVDDLEELPILVTGESDNSFDTNDKIIFYAEGPSTWRFHETLKQFVYDKNVYDTQNYYFIKIANTNGKRITERASLSTTDYTSTSFDARLHYEDDRINLLHDYQSGQGSGQKWFGDLFEVVRERTYDEFNIPNIIVGEPARIKADFAGRSGASSRMTVLLDNQEFTSNTIGSVNTGNTESKYADTGRVNTTFTPSKGSLPVTIRYEENSASSKGWLDYIEIQAKAQLRMTGNQLAFRDTTSTLYSTTTFELANANGNTQIWDISNPLSPVRQTSNLTSSKLNFGVATNILREFVAFNSNETFTSPTAVGAVANQNIHGIDDVDFVIVHPVDFQAEAEQLAEHRRQYSGMNVATVVVTDIYNEFSSGRLDPTAIRDFAKMLHDRNERFKYLLLLGDGSFDARGLYSFEQKSDFVPVYETPETLAPIDAYPSDDYFGLLSDDEGLSLTGAMDIAVGRLPVKSNAEAQAVINKIIKYDTDNNLLGDWRNRIVFVADDEDTNLHINDADGIADFVDTTYADLNIDKIYLDAFQQISTPGGEKYPAVTEALNKAMFKGVLVVNYLGHGGSKGWTQERVLNIQAIESWENTEHFPLLVTATCSFSGYDDPAFVTAGERTFLNGGGGSIGLFTTVRAVFANSNEQLTRAAFEQLFEVEADGSYPTIGEILRKAKNSRTTPFFVNNSRKFTLLGDPSMQLALPQHNVATTSIDGTPVSAGMPDTLRALQKVTITGQIEDNMSAIQSDFNGTVFPTIFDKAIQVSTLVNDSGSREKQFTLQKNIIFKGAATVQNGQFEFTFVVPKDINYDFGKGKISYYAKENTGLRDAKGSYENIIIGGSDPNIANDDTPPLVEVYMNNEDFVFGGVTDENPILLVKLSDDNGINVAGSSVGHDLTGTLDENTQNNYLLNDFYEAKLDDYTSGVVRFPLFNVPSGRHSISVKAWDVANNSAEGLTEFVVAESANAALEHVLNYPNPFTTNTNFQFEHNMADQLLNVQIRIFTVAGRLVKTIDEQLLADGYRITDIAWNGTDDFGDQLARGVYLYKVKIASAEEGLSGVATESEFEKLVILK